MFSKSLHYIKSYLTTIFSWGNGDFLDHFRSKKPVTKSTVTLLPIPDGNVSDDSFGDEEQDSDHSEYEHGNTYDLDDEVVGQESSEEVDVDENSDRDLDQKKYQREKAREWGG